MAGMNKIKFNSPISLQNSFYLSPSSGDQEVYMGDGRMDFRNYTGPVTLERCGSYNKIISVDDGAIYLAYKDYDHDNDYPLESYINLKKDHGGSSSVIIELGAIAGGGAIMTVNSDGYISADAVFKAQAGIVTNSIIGPTGSDALNKLTMSNSGVELLHNSKGIEINNDGTIVNGDYVSISQGNCGITLASYGLKIEHNGEESAINFENNNGLDIYSYNKAKFHVDKDDKQYGLFLNGDSTDKLVLNGSTLTPDKIDKIDSREVPIYVFDYAIERQQGLSARVEGKMLHITGLLNVTEDLFYGFSINVYDVRLYPTAGGYYPVGVFYGVRDYAGPWLPIEDSVTIMVDAIGGTPVLTVIPNPVDSTSFDVPIDISLPIQ